MKKSKYLFIIILFLFPGIIVFNNYTRTEAKIHVNIISNGEIESVTGSGRLNIEKNITGFTNAYTGNDVKSPWQASITGVTVSDKSKYFMAKDGVLYNKKMTELVYYPSHKKASSFKVPDTIKSIGCYAFFGNRYLEKVVLNEGVKKIGWEAFKSSNIEIVNIPESVREIGYGCFSGCRKLKKVNNKASLSEIEDNTFRNCISLKKLELGSNVNKISEKAFYNCGAVINIPDGNQNYATEDGILYSADIKKLIRYPGLKGGSYILPGDVHMVSPYAFTGCRKLKSLELNGYITDFPLSQLNGCISLERLVLPENLQKAGFTDINYNGKLYTRTPVYGLVNLKEIKVHEDNAFFSVHDNALYSAGYEYLYLIPHAKEDLEIHKNTHYILDRFCQNQYTKITVQDGNKYLASYKGVLYDKNMKTIKMFPGKLESYRIPASLKNADAIINYLVCEEEGYRRGSYVKGFNDAAGNLKNITVEKGNKYFSSKNGVLFNLKGTEIYLYPRARKGKYIIPSQVRKINDNAFAGAHKLTRLVVPSSVKNAGINISGCKSLKKVVFKEGVKTVYIYGGAETDFYGFMGRINVKNIYLPGTLENITIEGINNNAAIHGYNKPGMCTMYYGEEDAYKEDIISLKNYITSNGYVYKKMAAV